MTSPDPFLIRAAVPDFDSFATRYAAASAVLRARHAVLSDMAYGPGARERCDVVLPDRAPKGAPLHVFVHGGYWRAGRKEDYTFVAAPVVAAGGVAALVEYDLMPGVRMADLVAQVRKAVHWLTSHATTWGADPSRLTASGHSAGAHLASYLAASGPQDDTRPDTLPRVLPRSLLLVSGIYDLAPIRNSFLQAEIALTPAEAALWSPVSAAHALGPARTLVVGGAETPPFHAQAQALRARLTGPAQLCIEPGLNHMNAVMALGDPDHPLGRSLTAMVTAS